MYSFIDSTSVPHILYQPQLVSYKLMKYDFVTKQGQLNHHILQSSGGRQGLTVNNKLTPSVCSQGHSIMFVIIYKDNKLMITN